jgi:hypothetical protein
MQGSIPGGGGGIISNDRGKVCPVSLSLSRYVCMEGSGGGGEFVVGRIQVRA